MRARQYQRMLRRAERRDMDSRCDVTRPGDPVTTPEEGLPCRVSPAEEATRRVVVAGGQRSMHVYEVRVPHDADVVERDLVTVKASDDPALVGRHLTVLEAVTDDRRTSRRLICHETR